MEGCQIHIKCTVKVIKKFDTDADQTQNVMRHMTTERNSDWSRVEVILACGQPDLITYYGEVTVKPEQYSTVENIVIEHV